MTELINTQISREVGEKVMTLAEQLIAEGHQKGIQEGLQKGVQKGKFEVAKQLLREGVEIAFIAKMTGLSLDKLKLLDEEALLSS